MPARLTLYGRRDCHLCHEAQQVVERVLGDYDARLEVVDVDTSPELAAAYGHEIPVLLLEGARAFKFRVEEARLRRRLRRWRRAAG